MEPIKSISDKRNYRVLTLSNKLKCCLVSDVEAEKSAACCSVHVGSMSDPVEAKGLAHFLEHMLFLGTEKYPEENAYASFLSSHGGSSNAYTSQEKTVYYFDIQCSAFKECLDIFASFFICPLFSESGTYREINAVNSEHSKNIQSDLWRSYQLLKQFADPTHPFSYFSTGNLETLKENPEKAGTDIRNLMIQFHKEKYSANIMSLTIYGKESLDELESWVHDIFAGIPNRDLQVQKLGRLPFNNEGLGKLVKVVPVKEAKSLDLTFQLPSVKENYEYAPDRIISHLVGHESEGSVLMSLKSRGWANALSSGSSETSQDFTLFDISIDLTDEGSNHIDEIVAIIFTYFHMLNRGGIPEWVATEESQIREIGFRHVDKGSAASLAINLSNALLDYKPEHILCATKLILKVDVSHANALLPYFTPENCLISIKDKKFQGKVTKSEKYYGTNYDDITYSQEQVNLWRSCLDGSNTEYSKDISFPAQNPLIPQDFSIRFSDDLSHLPKNYTEPSLLLRKVSGLSLDKSVVYSQEESDAIEAKEAAEASKSETVHDDANKADKETEDKADEQAEEGAEEGDEVGEEDVVVEEGASPSTMSTPSLLEKSVTCWYKIDSVWKTPKALVTMVLASSMFQASPLHSAMSELLDAFLNERLSSPMYFATCVGFRVNSQMAESFRCEIYGYHDKLPVLLQMICEELKRIPTLNATSEEVVDLFARVKERTLEHFINWKYYQPYQTCHYMGVVSCLEERVYPINDKITALRNVDINEFLVFVKQVIRSLRVEMLVNGNATPAEARSWSELVVNTLGCQPLSTVFETPRRFVNLTPGVHYIYRKHATHFNPAEKNSCVDNIFAFDSIATASMSDVDLQQSRLRNEAISEVLRQMLAESFFDQLRTKEQLGYIVFCNVHKSAGMVGMYTIVQSNHKSPEYIDKRIDCYLEKRAKDIEALSDSEIEVFKTAVCNKLVEKPKNLENESLHFNHEIYMLTYIFDRSKRLAAIVPTLTKQDLLDAFRRFMVDRSTRRKFSSYFYGQEHKYRVCKDASVVHITDPATFKQSMPMLVRKSEDADFVPHFAE